MGDVLSVGQRINWHSLIGGQFVAIYQTLKPHTPWLSISFQGHILVHVHKIYTQGQLLQVLVMMGKDREHFNCIPAGDWLNDIILTMGY